MTPDAGPQPSVAPLAARATAKPPLVYILAAFGLIAGAFGAQHAINLGVGMLAPRDAMVQVIEARNEPLKGHVAAADLDKYTQREADARYGRRNAALPLAAVGLVLSCLLFAGCLRAMRGDPWGLSAWSLAATASLPYQLICIAFAWVNGMDLDRALADAPSSLAMLKLQVYAETLGGVVLGGFAIAYFGACALYLRTAPVRRAFSDGERTTPSA